MTYYGSMIILIPAILFTMYAQAKVNSNFRRYSNVRNARNMTGAEAARRMLDANRLGNVQIEQVRGSLTDHYDPRKRVLRLSQSVYGVNSIAAVSVACHEAGHAVQHAESYKPLTIRNSIVPVVNFASGLTWPLVILAMANAESWKKAISGMQVMMNMYFTSFPFHPQFLNFNANIGISAISM